VSKLCPVLEMAMSYKVNSNTQRIQTYQVINNTRSLLINVISRVSTCNVMLLSQAEVLIRKEGSMNIFNIPHNGLRLISYEH
jgi:hypothetical protein